MRRKNAMKWKIVSILTAIWVCVFIVLLIIVKNKYFVGINAKDVDYITQVMTVDYTVSSIRQNTQADSGAINYKLTFVDDEGNAPEFSVNVPNVPADMALGNVYSAKWLQVVGSVYGYSRSKDLISVQFAEQSFDNTVIAELRNDIYDALEEVLGKRLNVLFYPVCLGALLVFAAVCLLILRISDTLTERYFVETVWDKIEDEIDSHKANVVKRSLDFKEELAVLREIAEKQRNKNRVVETKKLSQTQGNSGNGLAEDIVLKPKKVKKPMRKVSKLQPVEEDIPINLDTRH